MNAAIDNRYRTCPASPASKDHLAGSLARDPIGRRILNATRRLTGGRSVRDADRAILAACSGGADSSALVLALAAGGLRVTAAHIRHDLRPASQTQHDEDRARALAQSLRIDFVRADAHVSGLSGNDEANARHARETSLIRLARERGIQYIATGHQADDQLETLLLRLTRGSGLAGLRAIHEDRPARSSPDDTQTGIRVIRPMLRVTHAQACTLCQSAGWTWAEDSTNTDRSRARAALRHAVLPALREADPTSATRASDAAAHLAEAHDFITQNAHALLADAKQHDGMVTWPRDLLRATHAAVLAEVLRVCLHHGADRVPARERRRLINAILDDHGGVRRFEWPGLHVHVHADRVDMRRMTTPPYVTDGNSD